MCRRLAVISAVIVGAALPGLASEPSREAPELRRYQAYLARQWFQQVGERRADETFGDLQDQFNPGQQPGQTPGHRSHGALERPGPKM